MTEPAPAEFGFNPPRPPGDGGADLHTHTAASDGLRSAAAVVARAREIGLHAVAVTDHDTTAGLAEAAAAGRQAGLQVIPGIELSTWSDRWHREIHLLGYGLPADGGTLAPLLAETRRARRERAREIVARLQRLGLDLTWDDVAAQAGAGAVGRPHVARALLRRGLVTSIGEAFDRYLAAGRPAFVPRPRLSPEAGIEALRGAGAVPVLAHPGLLRMSLDDATWLESLRRKGLAGIEAFHSRHTHRQVARVLALARRLELLVTGGSDCHGPGPGQPELLGSVRVPSRWVERLLAAAMT